MAGISTKVGNTKLQIAHEGVEEAPSTPCGSIDHNHIAGEKGALVVTRLVPPGLGRGDGAWLGPVNEAIVEAHVGCLTISREKRLTTSL